MQLPVGEYIRQLRRQRSLTQTELGGEHFSKSYVSAVERDKIVPSHDALHFFAAQLDQPVEAFELLVQQSEQSRHASSLDPFVTPATNQTDEEIVALLDLVLKGKEYYKLSLPQAIADFPLEIHSLPSQQKQARYAFLKGLQAQENDDLPAAQTYLEYALALSPAEYQPAILDALGTNYYLTQAYECALDFHKRALRMLQEQNAQELDLFLGVELHCANDYRSIRAHYEACFHYEQARRYLRASHNMQIAGELYLGLGYCMYASLFQPKATPGSTTTRLSPEEMDQSYQLSLNFLLQSRTLYQVSSDQIGEFRARLTQAMVLLDFSTWRQQVALEQADSTGQGVPFAHCATLLDDAEEQCRQVLMGWQGNPSAFTTLSTEQQIILYTALAYLVRVFTQRAVLARVGGYYDTATKERSLAIHVCEQTLESLQKQELSWTVVRDATNLSGIPVSYHSPSLPRLPDPFASQSYYPATAAEVYFSAAEISEELGRVSNSPDYTEECYTRSDRFLQLTLDSARLETPDPKRDSSYFIRFYQRYMLIIEKRSTLVSSHGASLEQLLSIFKDALSLLQRPDLSHKSFSSTM
ncbi:MAG: hypothetical protein NVSMB44_02550 [Ktedonobacteraceae bacterium]